MLGTEFIWGNIVLNVGGIGFAIALFKRWMNQVDASTALNRAEVKQTLKENNQDVKDNLDINRREVKESLNENRKEVRESIVVITEQVKGIHVEMQLANGRTAKIEGDLNIHVALCQERQLTRKERIALDRLKKSRAKEEIEKGCA